MREARGRFFLLILFPYFSLFYYYICDTILLTGIYNSRQNVAPSSSKKEVMSLAYTRPSVSIPWLRPHWTILLIISGLGRVSLDVRTV